MIENIFKKIPNQLKNELFEKILDTENLKIERIISKGHSSPKDFWYNQQKNEWVILLKGSAKLIFEEGNKEIFLKKGDYLNIPAKKKHRVSWTDPNIECVWLAIYY